MKEIVLITGSKGMIARELVLLLEIKYSLRFLTRIVRSENEYLWDIDKNYIDYKALLNVKHIVHLAGANISEGRWTNKRKAELISSRVDASKLIMKTLQEHNIIIDTFVSASAIGFYGSYTSSDLLVESDNVGSDFLAVLCNKWEKAANKYKISGSAQRVVILRFGIILSPKKGALHKIYTSVKYYLGAPFSNGEQFMPWVHVSDVCKSIEFVLENKKAHGAYNIVAPSHVNNRDFVHTIAQIIKRPIIIPCVPRLIVKLIFGEMSCILLEGTKISPSKIKKLGFRFEFANLKYALTNLLGK